MAADAQTSREVRPLVVPKLHSILPCVLKRLGVQGLDRYSIEMDVTVTPAGGFCKPHKDNANESHRLRKINYVYYFHRQPQPFSGGDLLIYDTNLATKDSDLKSFLRVKPRHNSLILFPSDYVHEITPVESASQDFADGRFTVNGWIWSRGENDAGAAAA